MSSSKPGAESPAADRAVAALTRYVRRTVRSTHEARAYLQRLGYPSDLITRAVQACVTRGELEDGACGRLWAEHWARQGYAWAAIRERLLAKGLDEAAVAAAARAVGTQDADAERARALLGHRRITGTGALRRARLARLLSAKGFDAETIEHLLEDTATDVVHER
jgi:SOS response regulatory protein OraA/RecX